MKLKRGDKVVVLNADRDWMTTPWSPAQFVGKRAIVRDMVDPFVVIEMVEGPHAGPATWFFLKENVGQQPPCPMEVDRV